MDPVRVDAPGLGDRKRQKLEPDDVHGRMPSARGSSRSRARERGDGVAGALGGAALALEHVGAHVSSTAARWPWRSCSVWCAPAETQAPSRSFSTASCAVGQSRPAPATRIFDCAGSGSATRAPPRPHPAATDVLAAERRDRRDRARVARRVAPRPLDLRRADDHLVGELGERRVGSPGHEPHRPGEGLCSLERQRRRALVRDADHQIGLGRREHRLERLHRRARRSARRGRRSRTPRTRPAPPPGSRRSRGTRRSHSG